jgi:hypothetical protein
VNLKGDSAWKVDSVLHPHRFLGIGLAAGVALWLLDSVLDGEVFATGTPGWTNNIVPTDAREWWMRGLAVLLIIALGAHTDRERRAILRAAEEHRVVVQSKLDEALTRVLDDFIPICSHCKAIRRGEEWVPLESYVTGQTKSQFSHGLCPNCLALYDDTDDS